VAMDLAGRVLTAPVAGGGCFAANAGHERQHERAGFFAARRAGADAAPGAAQTNHHKTRHPRLRTRLERGKLFLRNRAAAFGCARARPRNNFVSS